MFIVFEGTDGSGTSTQAKNVANFLTNQGKSVFHTTEPSTSAAGIVLREILTHQKNLEANALQVLFFSDRLHHIKEEIIPALKRGETVICERYVWSSIAYGNASGVNEAMLLELSSHCLVPDLTIFLDVPEEISLERIEKRGQRKEHFEKAEVLKTVRKVMQKLAKESFHSKKVLHLDASGCEEEIVEKILSFHTLK